MCALCLENTPQRAGPTEHSSSINAPVGENASLDRVRVATTTALVPRLGIPNSHGPTPLQVTPSQAESPIAPTLSDTSPSRCRAWQQSPPCRFDADFRTDFHQSPRPTPEFHPGKACGFHELPQGGTPSANGLVPTRLQRDDKRGVDLLTCCGDKMHKRRTFGGLLPAACSP